ncbi:MAG: nucleotidyltransferase [Lentisphaerae bacterium]|nr:nucleotidyltransferase [Lentisphaerota bacterium]
MRVASVHVSKPVDASVLGLFDRLTAVAGGLGVPILVIGAAARDLVFEHVYGVLTERATRDVDVAVVAKTWAHYAGLRDALVGAGLTRHPTQVQRLSDPSGVVVDMIPYGDVAEADGCIRWPDDGALMSVVGFEDAFRHAVRVQIRKEGALPALVVPVASPPALAVLKLVAWNDRQQERRRDMVDLAFIIKHYLEAGNRDRLLRGEHPDLLAREHFDSDLVSAELLGRDMRSLASARTREVVAAILRRETGSGSRREMLHVLRAAWAGDFRRAQTVARELCAGFTGAE